jgi:hypothetical protein
MVKYLIAIVVTCSFLFTWNKAFSEIITTDNLLSNSGFTGGTSSWTNHGTTQQHHVGLGNECVGSAVDNSNSGCGVSGSLAGVDNGGVSQTITLSDTTSMTQAEINNGFTSTMSTDIWFWHGQDTVTMKQELTDSTGNVSTQTRVVIGSHNNYQTYTDTSTIGANTSTDYNIKVSVDIDDSANSSGHAGPDVDNVTLNVNYTYIPPIDDTTQTIIDDIDTDIVDIIDDIPEDFDWYEEEYTWEDDYIIEEELDMGEGDYFEDDFYFEEELDFDVTEFDSPPMFEEFEEFDMEEMPTMEEVFFEEAFVEPPPAMIEEVFTEEFEEDFTSFIEETGLEEEFEQFLEEEGITAEEFFEEITEEEFSDELTDESFEEFEEEMVEGPIDEESPPEITEETRETSEETDVASEPIEEEKEVASNDESTEEEESTEEDKSSSEDTEESDVQAEDSEEQDGVQSEGRDKVDTNDRVVTDVAKVESKLKKNLKAIAKQIAKVTKQNTQNLTKEDIFFKNNTLDAYNKTQFYKSKDIYNNQNLDLFNQVDLSVYNKEIYGGVTLSSYTQNDPVEVHRVQLQEAVSKTRRLQLELQAMKNGE